MSKGNGKGKSGHPAAGCTGCGASAWVLILDAYPPNHTKIVHLVCAACKYAMLVDIPLDSMRVHDDRTPVEEDIDEKRERLFREFRG
jgi:hypothetical protein